MKSILDVEVSLFNGFYDVHPQRINLLDFLTNQEYAEKVERLRSAKTPTEKKQLKARLPAITPSGVFKKRNKSDILSHSGLIQFDIDAKQNLHISNFEHLKDQLRKVPFIAYCGLSVSGNGLWGLIPISDPSMHHQHFSAIELSFKKLGIKIDPLPKSICSLRASSYDPLAYFNHDAKVFWRVYIPKTTKTLTYGKNSKLDLLVRNIERSQIDITAGYNTWLNIGFALVTELGNDGREYFHRISQFYHSYDEAVTNRQYNHCLKAKGYGVSIASLFYAAKLHGITPNMTPPGRNDFDFK